MNAIIWHKIKELKILLLCLCLYYTQIRKAREIRRVEEPESGYEIIAKTAEDGKRFNRKFQQSACFLRKFVKQR